MNTETDAARIARARTGNSEAMSALYTRYRNQIFAWILTRTRDPLVAEDLCSDTFLRFLECLPTYQERGYAAAALLYRIASGLVIDQRRRDRVRRHLPLAIAEERVAYCDPQFARLERYDTSVALGRALGALTADQRQVIALRFGAAQDLATTATTLGRSVHATKALQRRAIAALRRQLR